MHVFGFPSDKSVEAIAEGKIVSHYYSRERQKSFEYARVVFVIR